MRRREEDEEGAVQGPLKKQKEQLERTLRKTKREVKKSERIQRGVRQQIAQLRGARDELDQIRQNLQTQLSERNQEIGELKSQINELASEQRSTAEILQQAVQYQETITQALEQLTLLNTDIDKVSDDYLVLIESDDDRKNVYLEYFATLLQEAGTEGNAVKEAVETLKTQNYDTVKDIVERLEVALDEGSEVNLADLLPSEKPTKKSKK